MMAAVGGSVALLQLAEGLELALLYAGAIGVLTLLTRLLQRGAIRAIRIDDRTIVPRGVHPDAMGATLEASRGAVPTEPHR